MSKFRTNIFLIQSTSNYLWASEVGTVKVDYFDFSCKKIEKQMVTSALATTAASIFYSAKPGKA